ncbi:MAG: FlgD immunoglobulin-like domain containing protein [Candidatus Zhuqueibacterota bacterium]
MKYNRFPSHPKQLFFFLLFFILLRTALFSQSQAISSMTSFLPAIVQPRLSPDGARFIYCGADYNGLALKTVGSDQAIVISTAAGAGYRANWSQDGQRIGFKLIHENGAQQPVFYDVAASKIIPVHPETMATGVPTFSNDGKIAFTVGEQLIIVDKDLRPLHAINLGHYANLAPISPDGKKVIFNDEHDQLWLLTLDNGATKQITNGPGGFFDPQWSPSSDRMICSSLTGYLYTYDVPSGKLYEIDRGSSGHWQTNDELLYCREVWDDHYQIVSSQIYVTKFNGNVKQQVQTSWKGNVTHPHFSTASGRLIYLSDRHIAVDSFDVKKLTLSPVQSYPIQDCSAPLSGSESQSPQTESRFEQMTIQSFDAPYLHQVYDTPDWFNGDWACGATSAMMALAYYKILPAWSCNCSYPYFHTSDYGRYICEIYTFNNYTYNIGGLDASSTMAYGGYGFIIQNNWQDTKSNMAKYANQHGVASSVDWDPTYTKLCTETDNLYPVVILNSLTTAGHYVLGIGYNQTQHSVVINDPYGNKNSGYVNYSGKNVIYDWPGYNSGHSNLNIVHCLIYMQAGKDLSIAPFELADTLTVGDVVPFETSVYNFGFDNVDSTAISFYLSPNNYFSDSDYFLGKLAVTQLAPVDTQIISTFIKLPDSLISKKYALGAFIDKEDSVKETSESNNRAYKLFVLKGYPHIYGFEPSMESIVSTARPQISVRFKDDYFGIELDSLKFFLDGENITQRSTIAASKITFVPDVDLLPGTHQVKVMVRNNPGFTTVAGWSFDIALSGVTESPSVLTNWSLNQNYPNPFNGRTNIQYSLAQPGVVTIQIYDIQGELVKRLATAFQPAGLHRISWDGRDERGAHVPSGLYFYQMTSGTFKQTRRMIYLK